MLKIIFFVVVGLAIGINLFAFIAEKLMHKRLEKIARNRQE